MSDLSKLHSIWGEELSYLDMKSFETVKTYRDTNHDTRSLVKFPDGKLFLYDFHEEMGFPNDTIYEYLFVVKDELEADTLANKHILEIKSTLKKWVFIPPNYNIQTVG